MNKDIAIVTVPSSPPEKTNYGFMTLIMLTDMLGRKLNAERYLYINKQHSYKDKNDSVIGLLSDIKNIGIKMDKIVYDTDYKDNFYTDLSSLIKNGYVKIKDVKKIICQCGKIDCLDIDNINYNFIQKFGDKKTCKFCGNICDTNIESSLVFTFPNIENKNTIQIIPTQFKNKSLEFYEKLMNSDMLISKKRNTGISYMTDKQKFNIDIDFSLFNYLSNIPQKKRIIIGTSHVIYHMVMMDIMDKIKNPDTENIFIAMPYIMGTCRIPEKTDLENYKKQIYMLGSITKNSDSKFNDSLFQLVTKDRKENYLRATYNTLMQQSTLSPNQTFFNNINSIYMNDFNMNNIFKRVKELLEKEKIQRQQNRNDINIEQR